MVLARSGGEIVDSGWFKQGKIDGEVVDNIADAK